LVDKREGVRKQVTKAIKHIAWYFSLLLTIFIVHRDSARRTIGKIYTWSTRSTAKGEMLAMAVIAMESTSKDKPKTKSVQFDTDSMTVGVNNRCTVCISDRREHFVGVLTLGRKVIKGFHRSKITEVMSGTIKWKWLDSNRLEHLFNIPGSFYVLEGKCRLSALGYSKYHRFRNNAPTNHKYNPIIMHPATAISDDESGVEDDQEDNWGRDGPDQDSTRG
jgi:hypothetical protein